MKARRAIVTCIIWAVSWVSLSPAATWYVATNGDDTVGLGTNWATAFLTVSNGIAHAATNNGDTVLVSNGTYAVGAQLTMATNMTLVGFGGWTNTILKGGFPSTVYRVLSLTHPGAVADGLTVTNGYVNSPGAAPDYAAGAGISMSAGLVRNCLITHNCTTTTLNHISGGGVYMTGGTLSNCTVQYNKAETVNGDGAGGGVFMAGGSLYGCVIQYNSSLGSSGGFNARGAGVYMKGASAVGACVIRGNQAYSHVWNDNTSVYGGGMYVAAGSVSNCLIHNNYLQRGNPSANYERGGGVYLGGGQLLNCTIIRNTAYYGGGNYGVNGSGAGVYLAAGSMRNCIVFTNLSTGAANDVRPPGATVDYSCAPELTVGTGTGNITNDPCFVDLVAANYQIAYGSPCFNTGTNVWAAGTVDLLGNPRVSAGTADMGAYELLTTGVPYCLFSGTPTNGYTPLQVTFTARAISGDTNGLVLLWDFTNDGTNETQGAMVTNTYVASGWKTVSCTPSNAAGQTSTRTLTNYIYSGYTYLVATNGTQTAPYDTWNNAFSNVQDAVAYATNLDTILVTNGVYNFPAQLAITKANALIGLNGASNTILRATYPATTNRLLIGFNPSAIIDGFTITNGFVTADYGAGIYMTNGLVRNCTITKNTANAGAASLNLYGGGVYMGGGAMSNCVVSRNTLQAGPYGAQNGYGYGGGVYVNAGTLYACTIVSNTVTAGDCVSRGGNETRGGGVYMAGGGAVLRSCIVRNNHALGPASGTVGTAETDTFGGGIYMLGGSVWNCLITGNKATRGSNWRYPNANLEQGGGVYLGAGSLLNCTIADNQCVFGTNSLGANGAGVFQAGGTMTNCIVYFNIAATAVSNNYVTSAGSKGYSCAPELPVGSGNQQADPGLVNHTNGDYHLLGSSPCIDFGADTAVGVDLEGAVRPLDGDGIGGAAYDMGCYEYAYVSTYACNFSTDTNRVAVNSLSNVVFTSQVDGSGAATNGLYYWWSFGTGTTPQEGPGLTVVTNTFGPGMYDVSLTVSNSLGQVTNKVRLSYIQVTSDNVYVSTNGTAVFPYETWTKATPSVSAGMSALGMALANGAAAGDMWLSNGTFNVSAQVDLSSPIRIHGLTNSPSTAIIRRDGSGGSHRVLNVNHAAALVEGVTLANGYLDSGYGGGVYLQNGTVRNCIISGNQDQPAGDYGRGGGLYMSGGLLTNSTVANNSALGGHGAQGQGGGVYVAGGLMVGCRVTGNLSKGSTTGYGGGAYGGGVYMTAGSVWSCLVTTNRIQRQNPELVEQGGGVYVAGGNLVNGTIVGNVGVTGPGAGGGPSGAGVFQAGGGVTNCIIYYNTVLGVATNYAASAGSVSHCCAPELTYGDYNVPAEPVFANAATGNYHLAMGSPCANAGINQNWMTNAVDLDGNKRIMNRIVDIGSYESGANWGSIFSMR